MQKSNAGSALALALSMASGLGLNGQIARAILGKPMRKPRGSGVQTEHDIARLEAAKAKRLKREQRNMANSSK